MFKKILIANRGEIACRIQRTAHRLGIKTVAIYSEVDQYSLHVDLADEAYCVGPALSRESYLNQEKIIEIARQTNSEAIHPGYGFLSENATFAERVINAGLKFIGPNPNTIKIMGDKLAAKALAAQAGVHLVPGSSTPITQVSDILEFGNMHGFPILLKAAAGGGGKGMRVIYNRDDIHEHFDQARSEALKSFGDDRIFIERYIENPRHIEIQILGDHHGNIIHLGERDCSLQRRHQKIIEEAPSPFVTPELRQQLTHQAIALAQAVHYDSAGTVEFIVSPNRECFFLEMNTRLQVEHPVTEMVYQLDLVEQMIRIAAGEKLAITQQDVSPHGWAIEARVYSEDPYQDFLPSTGRITTLRLPKNDHLRIDAGVREGDIISMYYDPMIGKVIAHGHDRATATANLIHGLHQIRLEGPQNNRQFLIELLNTKDFKMGQAHTHLIEQNRLTDINPIDCFHHLSPQDQQSFLALAIAIHQHLINPYDQGELVVIMEGQAFPSTPPLLQNEITWITPHQRFSCKVREEIIYGEVQIKNSGFQLGLWGIFVDVIILRQSVWQVLQHLPPKREKHELKLVKSPMPGVLVSLPIAVGDKIRKGQTMAVIEAMKMENAIKAPVNGVITEILVSKGENLSRDQIIAKFGT